MFNPYQNPQINMNEFQARFNQFRQSVQGDPRQIIQQQLQSGRLSQQQVDAAFHIARNMGFIR